MKKPILFILVSFFMVSCNQETKEQYSLISGLIENPKNELITIYNGREQIQEITVQEDGTFQDTLKLDPGYYSFSHGRERSTFFLNSEYNLTLNLNTEEFDESISYEGIGSEVNNYLAQKYLYNESTTGSTKSHFSLEESDYMDKVNNMKTELLSLIEKSEITDMTFKDLESKNLEFERINALQKYESYHAYYADKPDFEVSDDFLSEEIKSMDYNDAESYKAIPSYRTLANRQLSDKINKALGEDFKNGRAEHFKALETSQIPELKDSYIDGVGRFMITPANPNMAEIYELFMNNLSDEDVKSTLTDRYNKNKNLMAGMPSPVFTNYENHSGGTTSLEDLKGKYVYIDVWATWCAPCIREVPYLKEIEKKYHDRNIEFVSTSIDVAADHNKWVEMVKDKELGGVQLFADNDWSSPFVKEYGIEGIPRFILIDPEGNIVTADAPRPSNLQLIEMFEELKL
ncbi:MAG: TlpA family protein disulfide reductase [Bacteroidia bacterium]|nr:TlpA family protein disulfide reductase [Bacteroidia bacterium]